MGVVACTLLLLVVSRTQSRLPWELRARFGGVTALGCTVGQGLTGFSTLALGSILAFLAIVAGSALTMKYQGWRMGRE